MIQLLHALRAETITTARLILEPLRAEHADEMFGVLADEALHEFTTGRPATLDQLRARYRRLATGRSPDGAESWLNWIVRRAGIAGGTVQATLVPDRPTGWRAIIAWVVGTPWQRQGIASEAARGLVDWLESHGARSISAHVHPQHEASQRVARRAGLVATLEVVDGEQVWRRARSTADAGGTSP